MIAIRAWLADPLWRAWGALLGLGLATTVASLAISGGAGPPTAAALGAGILGLAFLKARLILRRYLGLDAAPGWAAGFETVLAVFMAVLLGLYLVPAML